MTVRASGPKETRFANPRLARLGIELLPLADLRKRVSASHLATPERTEFFMLLLLTQGHLRHTIDFVDLSLTTGSLVFVRPGQVQHWHLETQVQGCLVLIDPPALLPVVEGRGKYDALLGAMEDWPAAVHLDEAFLPVLQSEFNRLGSDLANYDESEHDEMLIRQALLGTMLRIARWHRVRGQTVPSSEVGAREVYRLFRRELERHFRAHWTVAEFARRLGYSESTLNRACLASAGQTAKVLIDRRVALEAARMLVHAQASVAEVGHDLGFSEATNFVRFFARMVGMTPTRFRAQH